MSPRGRHADRETTDPFGFPPVADAAVPSPRRPDHSGGWAGRRDPADRTSRAGPDDRYPPAERTWLEPDPAAPGRNGAAHGTRWFSPDDRRGTGPDTAWDVPAPEVDGRWTSIAARRRAAVAGDLFAPPGRSVPRVPGSDQGDPDAPGKSNEPDGVDIDDRVPRNAADPGGGFPLRAVLIPVAAGSLVAVALGVLARQHEGTGVAVNLAGFSSGAAVKAWLGSLALLLAIVQGVTGRMLHRGSDDPMTAAVHRWSGRAAVLVTVPVAVQCLYAYGWSGENTSVLLHSALGCVFYGAFVTKMLLLRRPGVPGWALAVTGGLLLALLSGVWLTSALWFFAGHGLSF